MRFSAKDSFRIQWKTAPQGGFQEGLDRKARAPTANRRSHSGVGGARRGVREYGSVYYHKVELKEQANRVSSAE